VSERWVVERLDGTAEAVFTGPKSSAALLQALSAPTIRFVTVDRPTMVLGSSQPDSVLDASRGLNVIRRRSGGGAVWLDPAEQVWVDVMIPATSQRWQPDVTTSFDWLGQVWRRVVESLGVPSASVRVHSGSMERSSWSDLLCFAGTGPGEVFVDGRKVVGMSQRRSRNAALFQCGALLRWTVDPTMFAPDLIRNRRAEGANGVGVGLDELVNPTPTAGMVERAFLCALDA
jgi:lipoate---protein ligase